MLVSTGNSYSGQGTNFKEFANLTLSIYNHLVQLLKLSTLGFISCYLKRFTSLFYSDFTVLETRRYPLRYLTGLHPLLGPFLCTEHSLAV